MFFNNDFEDFHLDIVGFLAILGEGSVSVNYQVSTLSFFTFLPRLMPAPQAFMPPARPLRLDDVPGIVVGARSGNCRHNVYRIPHIILPGEQSMKISSDYTVRRFKIKDKRDNAIDKEADREANNKADTTLISARTFGPLSMLAMLGCAMSIALLGLSIHFNDGWALIATILLSFLSSLLGVACKWTLKLVKRQATGKFIPPADVVVCYPNGSFLIVECDEEIARFLFFAPERCNYLITGTWYRFLALFGTMMLMFGVIALGNAGARMQIGFGASYLLLNAAYWLVAALPESLHWDYSSLEITEPEPEPKHQKPADRKFRDALWKAIKITKTTRWVRTGRIAPDTEAWTEWLKKADEVVNRKDGLDPETWDYSSYLNECLGEYKEGNLSEEPKSYD
ncbi:hypothetical protein BDV25DRAFT_159521 [Aspergillus avenaceus]|uniref:Uncharacterized protein n=1 Tax=Aspergillus avenaceus TaxID=36643 RepID=A0A5N6TN85_ASPAV|nr:hypothetical protein BDV25DRAFT_159521 [Aspergillus avenaceus]